MRKGINQVNTQLSGFGKQSRLLGCCASLPLPLEQEKLLTSSKKASLLLPRLEEAVSKTNVVFGESAEDTVKDCGRGNSKRRSCLN